MTAYLLTWNPDRFAWADFDVVTAVTAAGERVRLRWSTGNTKSVCEGDRVFLVRQARDRGLVGAGHAACNNFLAPHWEGSGKEIPYVHVEFEVLLSVVEVLPVADLEDADLGVAWGSLLASGFSVPDESLAKLEGLWQRHLARLGRLPAELPSGERASGSFVEGAVSRVCVNAYERNSSARRVCLAEYGTDCVVCGFNFGQFYGPMGEGFIHVHHLRDLATIGREYQVNPVVDLRPVCPNCHAMLHTRTPALSIEELRQVVEARRSDDR
jgi:5-methylcytosine-specific restriction protein A